MDKLWLLIPVDTLNKVYIAANNFTDITEKVMQFVERKQNNMIDRMHKHIHEDV